MKKYKLFGYEIWGNSEDGFDVNDVHVVDDEIELAEGASDEEILEAVEATEGVTICGHSTEDFIEFLGPQGYHIGRLELIK